jgi:predicted nucleic-acid-binding protein
MGAPHGLRGVFVEEIDVVLTALEEYALGVADFADLLLVGTAAMAGAVPLLTFDRKLSRHGNAALLS